MIGILNYGSGNIKSLSNALENIEEEYKIVNNKNHFKEISKLIIPGVGSYSDTMLKIIKKNFLDEIRNFAEKKCVLGICVGMQILSDNGHEEKHTQGLKIIKGSVKKIYENQQISHVGWNNLVIQKKSILFKNLHDKCDFYFVHAYHFCCKDKKNISAQCIFNKKNLVAVVESKNVFGVQFHPEKSHKNGLKVLKNFCKI